MILWNLRIREKETDELVCDIYEDDPGAYGRVLDGDYQREFNKGWFILPMYDVSVTAISVN